MTFKAKRRMGPDGKAGHVVLNYHEGTEHAFTVLLYWDDYQQLRKLKLSDGTIALESLVLDRAGNPCLPSEDAAKGLVPIASRWLPTDEP